MCIRDREDDDDEEEEKEEVYERGEESIFLDLPAFAYVGIHCGNSRLQDFIFFFYYFFFYIQLCRLTFSFLIVLY